MGVNQEMRDLVERISALEATVKYLDQNIHELRKQLREGRKMPTWIWGLGAVNAGIFAWLAALTKILLTK